MNFLLTAFQLFSQLFHHIFKFLSLEIFVLQMCSPFVEMFFGLVYISGTTLQLFYLQNIHPIRKMMSQTLFYFRLAAIFKNCRKLQIFTSSGKKNKDIFRKIFQSCPSILFHVPKNSICKS